MQKPIPIATVQFPEIRLPQRAASQLRGFFGNYFREHSPLLHNHYDDGSSRYRYPLVQYKVLRGVPVLVGLLEGAQVLTELFFRMKSIDIAGKEYPVMERDIAFKNQPAGVTADALYDYRFQTDWMALNQQNYAEYLRMDDDERRAFLGRILTGNILSFLKGVEIYLPDHLRIMTSVRPGAKKMTGFKNNLMTTISGEFTTNALLPDGIGLGRSVSRGYGAIEKIR